MRVHLDHGFDIPHLVLNDGTLTPEDFRRLEQLPNIHIEYDKVHMYENVPKAVYLAKLECFNVGFNKYNVERVVIFDCDIFFFRSWEADLRKILSSPSIVLRDWGSSLGPNVHQYIELFGVHEDATTPNCNTGINSITRDQYPKLEKTIAKHVSHPFMMMEDQGAMFAAFYGQLEYINGIKCAAWGGETHPEIKAWWYQQNALHLMGMRERPQALQECIDLSIQNLPEYLTPKQFIPITKFISWGLLEHDTYNFNATFQYFPSTHEGKFITSGMYFHGGSRITYKIPAQFSHFTCKFVCMDTGIKQNMKLLTVNGCQFYVDTEVVVNLPHGELTIESQDGAGAHIALLEPKFWIDKSALDFTKK